MKLNQISALQHAVFLVNYHSARQRALRCSALLLITAKHGVRGLLYVWPLALLLFIPFSGPWRLLRVVLIAAAIGAWFRFIYGAVRDDYGRHACNRLLKPAALWKMW
ncbi:MAG: hypothetical protein ACYDC8_10815 [Gammaproteobacteria bacterium]